MKTRHLAIALGTMLALAGCSDPTSGVAPATVNEPATQPAAPTPTAAPTAPAGRQTLTVDRATSSVGFTGAKITDSHTGTFSDFTATLELDPANVTASSVNVSINMDSLQIEPERLLGHLKSPDLFDVAQFPTATFRSTSVTEGGTGTVGGTPATHTVTGDLTMHGQTRSISFPAVVAITPTEVTARSEFTIQRQEFGIVYPGMPDDLIHNDVVIRFNVRAPRS